MYAVTAAVLSPEVVDTIEECVALALLNSASGKSGGERGGDPNAALEAGKV